MTAALLESPLSLFGGARRLEPASGRGTTLEERLGEALRAAQADGMAECPVCRRSMRFEGGAARCEGCGSTLC